MDSTACSGRTSPTSPSQGSIPSTPGTERDVLFEVSPLPDDTQKYILVTGGLGFIGSHTSAELLKAGYNVIIVDDLSNSFRDVFDRVLMVAKRHYERVGGQCPQAKFYDMDYRNIPAMRDILSAYTPSSSPTTMTDAWNLDVRPKSTIAGVIHFAAFKAVEESIRQPLKYYRNNINGLVEFLDLLDGFGIKTFIFSSSATVYGTLADRGQPLREEHCVHERQSYEDEDGTLKQNEQGCTGLTNPYGRTKYFGEAILADLAVSDPSWTIMALRYFNPVGCDSTGLLGEDPRGSASNLVPVVVQVMTGQRPELNVFGSDWDTPDGTAIRDFIHVTDLAKGHIAALSAANTPTRGFNGKFNTFNLGTGCGNSVTSIVNAMESIAQRPIPRRLVGRRAGDVGSCVAVAKRAANELNWTTEKTIEDACRDICHFLSLRGN